MASQAISSNSNKIKWAITILIPVIIFLIPCTEVYTMTMKKFFIITVFSLLCAAFEFFPNLVIGLMIPIGYILHYLIHSDLNLFGQLFSSFCRIVLASLA